MVIKWAWFWKFLHTHFTRAQLEPPLWNPAYAPGSVCLYLSVSYYIYTSYFKNKMSQGSTFSSRFLLWHMAYLTNHIGENFRWCLLYQVLVWLYNFRWSNKSANQWWVRWSNFSVTEIVMKVKVQGHGEAGWLVKVTEVTEDEPQWLSICVQIKCHLRWSGRGQWYHTGSRLITFSESKVGVCNQGLIEPHKRREGMQRT